MVGSARDQKGPTNVCHFHPRDRHHVRRRFHFRASARFGCHLAPDRLNTRRLQPKETRMNGRFLINRRDAKVMGVAAGLADYTGIDPLLVRLGFVAAALITGPVMILFYVVAGLLAPER